MKLGNWPNFATPRGSCYPRGSKLSIFSIYGQQFPRCRPIFKIAIFVHQIWPLAKVPEGAHILSFYPRGSKLSLFLLYGQRFPRYGPIFKIAIFGHEIWPLTKVPEVAHMPSFYPRGSKLTLFSLHGQWFPRYRPVFKSAIFEHDWSKFQKLHKSALSYPPSQNFTPFCSTAARFQDIGNFSFSHWPMLNFNLFF